MASRVYRYCNILISSGYNTSAMTALMHSTALLKLEIHHTVLFCVFLILIKTLKINYEAKNIANAGLSRQVGWVQL